MSKLYRWFIDKYEWLKTFNNPPTVHINFNKMIVDISEGDVITIKDRVTLNVTGDIIILPNNYKIENGKIQSI